MIVNRTGAEQLVGHGDMLFFANFAPESVRMQGAFISDNEVRSVTSYLKEKYGSHYDVWVSFEMLGVERDLLKKAVEVLLQQKFASSSIFQSDLGIYYRKADRIIKALEINGFIGPLREVLITEKKWNRIKEQGY